MDERQHASAEQREVPLELAGAADAVLDGASRCRSQNSRVGRAERRPAARVQLRAARRWARADQLQQFGCVSVAIRGHAQLEARELRRAQVQRDDARGILRQQRQRVVAGRGDRHADVARLDVEACEQDVGVLPDLRVADGAEIGARRGFATHRSRPAVKCAESMPVLPSISTQSPSFEPARDARDATRSAGIPSSRATMAACESRLPRSTSTPSAEGNTMIQPGSVCSATRIARCSRSAVARIGHDAHRSANDARAAAEAVPLVA